MIPFLKSFIVRSDRNTHACGYPQVKSNTNMGHVGKWISTGIINGYFYLFYGYGHGFDDARVPGYPYPIIN